MVVAVNKLYIRLYEVFKEELIKLNIGYDFNRSTLLYMNDLVNAIEYLRFARPDQQEASKIIQKYDKY